MISSSINNFLGSLSSIGSALRARADANQRPIAPPPDGLERAREVEDSVQISGTARTSANAARESARTPATSAGPARPGPSGPGTTRSGPEGAGGQEIEHNIRELSRRDREVRAHEAAHKAAGGSATPGSPSYSYQLGPDGKRYASGGEIPVQITSSSDDPNVRVHHAQQVVRAALAPADPSGADLAAAAAARQEIVSAQRAIREDSYKSLQAAAESTAAAPARGSPAAAYSTPQALGQRIDRFA